MAPETPLPPNPLEPLDPFAAAPELVDLLLVTDPELRAAVVLGCDATDDVLFPTDAALDWPAMEAALLVAALTRALESAADFRVAAVPPPVPADWPDTALRAAWTAWLLEVPAVGPDVLGPVLSVDGGT